MPGAASFMSPVGVWSVSDGKHFLPPCSIESFAFTRTIGVFFLIHKYYNFSSALSMSILILVPSVNILYVKSVSAFIHLFLQSMLSSFLFIITIIN